MSDFEKIVQGVAGPLVGLVMGGEPDAKGIITALLRASSGVLSTGVAGYVPPIVGDGLSGLVELLNAADSSGQRAALMGLAESFAAEAERLKFGGSSDGTDAAKVG